MSINQYRGGAVMDYKIIIYNELKTNNINLVIDSKCWTRTHAHIDGTRRICKLKIADSYASLFTALHEIGHVVTNTKSMKRCEQESYATMWGINRLKELGLPVKRKYVNLYKSYIRMTYSRGLRRGLKKKIKSKLYI